jgi:hypothetical protein
MNIEKKIGCDPELFLFDKKLDRIVPACGIVEGSKESPIMLINGGMVQLDGTVLEFGTPPVAPEGNNFSQALKQTLDIIRAQLSEKHGDRYELRCGAIAKYASQDIKASHEGLLVGCSPQYVLADFRKPVRVILDSQGKLKRNAVPIGGHIHFGFVDEMVGKEVMDYSALRYNKALISSGLREFMRDVDCDATAKRKYVMGFPENIPTIRIKPYGVEFRNLSSYWLACPAIADFFSIIHTLAVDKCLGTNTGERTVIANTIRRRFEQLSVRIREQDPKYQQTLPLAY